MSNEVIQRRCRRSPTGIEDCFGSTGGTGSTGDFGDQAAGGLSLSEVTGVYETEGGNFIALTSLDWSPQALSNFTDLGNGELQYDGPAAIFHIAASATFTPTEAETPDVFFLTYAIDGVPLSGVIVNSQSSPEDGGGSSNISISDEAFLSPGMVLSLYGTTEGGTDFSLLSGQISATRAG